MDIPSESLLTEPPPAPPPGPPVSIPALDDVADPQRRPAPPPSREQARMDAAQLHWKGRPIRWTFGRLALWQALSTAAGGGSAENMHGFLDSAIFLFLATHDESVWESSPVKAAPPLICDHMRFLTTIRKWADAEFPPTIDAGLEAIDLFNRVMTAHTATQAAAVPSEEDAAAAAETANP